MSSSIRLLAILLILFVWCASVQAEPHPQDDELILGVFPRRNATDTITSFEPMARFLSKQLGRPVHLVTSMTFAAFWHNVETRRYDIVHFNQYHYAKSHKLYGYNAILKNEENGESTIAASIVVRKDSGLDKVADLKDRRIIFGGGPTAMQSYIGASYLLQLGGLKEQDYQTVFARNPPNAILAAYYRQADAAGSGDKVLNFTLFKNAIDREQLKYLVTGPQLPHLPWAVSPDIADALSTRIQQILAGLDKTPAGRKILASAHLTGLRIARDNEYNQHRLIIREILNEDYCVNDCGVTNQQEVVE